MPYWLETDAFGDDQRWEALSGGKPALVDALQAAYCRLKARSSHLKSNGYLTEQTALRECRGRRQLLAALTTAVLGEAPFIHEKGDDCDCLVDAWVDGYRYRIHAFLKKNPSRSEYERNQAQKAELRDPRLRALLDARDGPYCRYCRSGPLNPKAGKARDRRKFLHRDHVDPDQRAGENAENLVICCGACGEYKGRRTPFEADMVLLPPPTPTERAAWDARGLALFGRPEYRPDQMPDQMPDQSRITDGSPTDHRSDADPISDSVIDPIGDTGGDPNDDPTGPVRPENGRSPANMATTTGGKGVGSGRVGSPVDGDGQRPLRPPPQPARDSANPDIYHRRSRASPTPYEGWPPGAVPADTRRLLEEPPDDRDP